MKCYLSKVSSAFPLVQTVRGLGSPTTLHGNLTSCFQGSHILPPTDHMPAPTGGQQGETTGN